MIQKGLATLDPLPKFNTPTTLEGEINMGRILSLEHYSPEDGYKTPYEYRIAEEDLTHGYFAGSAGTGKTVAAMRLVKELSEIRRKKTGERLRIVCMDTGKDWRKLSLVVEPERFRFYHMANPEFHPLKLNPCKIPKGVKAFDWVDTIVECYSRSYGFLERGEQMIAETFYELYDKAGVFEAQDKPDWKETVPELSKQVTFVAAREAMKEKYEEAKAIAKANLDENGMRTKGSHDTVDACSRLLERLSPFGTPYSVEYTLYGSPDGLSIDELFGDDDITVLEGKGLEGTFRSFIFSIITCGTHNCAKAQEDGFLADNQYETVLMIEDADELIHGFEFARNCFEFARKYNAQDYGVFIFAITRSMYYLAKIATSMCGLNFAGNTVREKDVDALCHSTGLDKGMRRAFPLLPIGWFVCQNSKTTQMAHDDPVLTRIEPLNVPTPTDKELDEILTRK